MRRLIALIVPLAFVTAACSGSNPAAPSPTPSSPGASTGTTISGSIGGVGSGSSTASTMAHPNAGPSSGIVVTIAGTTISASVDNSGKFTLTNVPGGTLTLQFSGPGVSGSLTIENVVEGQTIELSLQLAGSAVTLESEHRSHGSEEQVEGRVESLPPTTAPNTLVVAGKTITTDGTTLFFQGGAPTTFASLMIGQRVHVKGQSSGGSLLATQIDIQNTNTDLPVNVNGVVTALGTPFGPTAFTFFVGDREVHGDATTEFFGGSVFADLIVGARVEVKGAQGDGFVHALRIHVSSADEDDDAADGELTGQLTGITPPNPPTLVIGSQTVLTTGATEVQRRGDRYTFAVLQIGQTIDVSGTSSGGTITAKKLTIESSTYDVDTEGAVVGSVTGTCPTLTFTIGSVTFSTTSFTDFKKTSCQAVLNGTDLSLKVRGMLTSATTAEAAQVEIKK